MFDKMVGFGASFDWITPLFAFVQDYRNRPSVGYNVPVAAGWSALYIERRLKQVGVKTWGLMIVGDTITFRVREAQALYAQYWLERDGIPYVGGLEGEFPSAQLHATVMGNDDGGAVSVADTQRKSNGALGLCLDGINRVVDRI